MPMKNVSRFGRMAVCCLLAVLLAGCVTDKVQQMMQCKGFATFSIVNETGSGRVGQAVADLAMVLNRLGIEQCAPGKTSSRHISYEVILKPGDDRLEPSQAALSRVDGVIRFYGTSESALAHVIYSYIKERLHTSWYMPGKYGLIMTGTKNDPFLLRQNQLKYRLPFLLSYQFWGESPKWHTRMREIRDRQLLVYHNWHKIMPPDMYFDQYPQYYAMVDGKREPAQLCTTNPEVIELVAQKVIDYFTDKPEEGVYSLSPDDGYNFCECPDCRGLDRSDGSITDRLMVFFNEVAKRLVKVHPDKKVAFYAYLNYTEPPVAVKPHPAVVPVICHTPWEFCHNHAVTDPDCPFNRRFQEICRRWCKLSKEVYIREYYTHFLWYGLWPILHSIEQDVAFYRSIGIRGIISESHEHWGLAGWILYAAGCYMAGEQRPWKQYVTDYSRDMIPHVDYVMQQFIMLLEERAQSVKCRRIDEVFDDATMQTLYACSAKMLDRAQNERGKLVARMYRHGLDMTTQLIDVCKARSAGEIERMISVTQDVLDTIETLRKNTDMPAVIKYPLAESVMARFLARYQKEKLVAQSFFSETFGLALTSIPAGIPVRNWLVSPAYPNEVRQSDQVSMYPPILDKDLVIGLDTVYPPQREKSNPWHSVHYDESYYSLYQYFPHRPDSIRYYRTKFYMKRPVSACIAVRAIDGYTLFVDDKEIATTKLRRFEKDHMFDWYPITFTEGPHELLLKLEGTHHRKKDDFTVMVFDQRGQPVELK